MIEETRQEEQRAQEERLRQEEQRKAKENEAQIIYKLHELGEKGKKMMPKIEALYRRQQQAQRQGILSNPEAQFDLNDAIGELIDIKNEQIRLAEQLGDQKLVKGTNAAKYTRLKTRCFTEYNLHLCPGTDAHSFTR